LGWAGAFAVAVLDGQQLLAAVLVGADEDQDALAVVVEARREVDPVGPDVDVAPVREIAPLPALVLLLPGRHQPPHGRRRQPGRVGAQQRRERLLELAGGHTLQVEPGQQLLDVPGPPQKRRQHLRGEADPLAAGAVAAVAHLRSAHLDRTDARLDLALRRVPVADDAAPAAAVLELGVRREETFDLGLDRLLQHPSCSRAQHLEQRIVLDAPACPRQPNNGIFLHGVSSHGDFEHHRGYATPALIHQIRS
jgi:hypothetical protein